MASSLPSLGLTTRRWSRSVLLANSTPVQTKQDTCTASGWPATCLFKWNKTPVRQAVGQQHACSNKTRHPYGKRLASNMPVQMKQDTLMASSWPATCLFKWNKTPLWQAVGQQHACSNETRHPYGKQHACSNETRHLYGKRLASNMPVQIKQDTLMASGWPATCLFKWNKTPLWQAVGQQHACSNETRHPYGKQLASNMPVQMKQDTLMASSWPATCLFKWNKTPLWPAVGQQHACSNETRHPYGQQLASNMPVQMKQDTLMASSWPATCQFKWNKTPLWPAVGQQHACSNETRHPYGQQLASNMPVQMKQDTLTASSWPATCLFKWNKTPLRPAVGQQHACSNETRHPYGQQLASNMPVQMKQDTLTASSWPATCLFKWNKTPLRQAVGQQHACSNETRHPYGQQLASSMPVQMKQDTLMASSWPAACLFKRSKAPVQQADGQQHACSNEARHLYSKQLCRAVWSATLADSIEHWG